MFQGACTECQKAQVVGKAMLYCRATGCDQTLKPTQNMCHACGCMQATGELANLKTLSVKNRSKAEQWECSPGLDRCLAAYKERWVLVKNLTPNDIAEAVWLVRTAHLKAEAQTKKNQEAARKVPTPNALGKKVMAPGGQPRLNVRTQEARVIAADYAGLESDFRKIVIQQSFQWGKNKRGREEDEAKDIRMFLRGLWNVFTGAEADAKQVNRVANEEHWKSLLGGVSVKNFRWCKVVFQASKEYTVDTMEKYRAKHPHIKFDTIEERIAMFKSLNSRKNVPTKNANLFLRGRSS